MGNPMLKPLDPFRFLLVAFAGWMNQSQLQVIDYLREDNRVLREQLGGRRLRLSDDQRRRLAAKAKLLGRRNLGEVATIVTPETLLAWHRKLIAQKYDGRGHRRPGHPRTPEEIEALIVRMAQENRGWGYERIQGALSNLGHTIGCTTIADIRRRHGVEPTPERSGKTTSTSHGPFRERYKIAQKSSGRPAEAPDMAGAAAAVPPQNCEQRFQ
jgi:hypothetical protein